MPNITPRIYVACLKSYNEGRLHGAWIDCEGDCANNDADGTREHVQERIQEQIAEMLAVTGGEEYAIHDYEGFGDASLSEYEGIDNVAALAAAIGEHGEAFAAYVAHEGGMEYVTVERFQDAYSGEWASEEEYAQDYVESSGMEIPDWLEAYIDWEKYAQDMFINDCYSVDAGNGNVYVFSRYA